MNFNTQKYLAYYERTWNPEDEGFQKYPVPNGRHYWFRSVSPNAKVLVVAHHDVVTAHNHDEQPIIDTVEVETKDGQKRELTRISNAPHDDRQGIATAMYTLPLMGIGPHLFDVLITTDEETGNSTAAFFEPPESKQYNWILQFDRNGSFSKWSGASYDVALYQYNTVSEWKQAVADVFGETTRGSFTDICYLGHLGAAAMNVAGYHNAHSKDSYMILEYYLWQVKQAVVFFKKYYHRHFAYEVGSSDSRALYMREPNLKPKPKETTSTTTVVRKRYRETILERLARLQDVLEKGLNIGPSFQLYRRSNCCAFCTNGESLWDVYSDDYQVDFQVCSNCLEAVSKQFQTSVKEVEVIEDDDDSETEYCCCCNREVPLTSMYGYIHGLTSGTLEYVCDHPQCIETASIVGQLIKFASYQ